MSTRAEYLIDGEFHFYIHHDGYPSGAAEYFNNARAHVKGCISDNFAEAFCRSNDRAELIPLAENHGDIEYKWLYNTKTDQLEGLKAHYDANDDKVWVHCFVGTLAEFLNRECETVKKANGVYKKENRLVTIKELKKELSQKKKSAKAYANKFPEAIGNINYANYEIEKLQKSIAELISLKG